MIQPFLVLGVLELAPVEPRQRDCFRIGRVRNLVRMLGAAELRKLGELPLPSLAHRTSQLGLEVAEVGERLRCGPFLAHEEHGR